MRKFLLVLPLALTCCAGSQISSVRFPADGACSGINVLTGGGGGVALIPPGFVGTMTITPGGCEIKSVGPWQYPAAPVTP